jgi:hypothetical protein
LTLADLEALSDAECRMVRQELEIVDGGTLTRSISDALTAFFASVSFHWNLLREEVAGVRAGRPAHRRW